MIESALVLVEEIQKELQREFTFLSHWRVTLDNAKRRAGICRLSCKEISISRNHILNNDELMLRDTVLHEFAHAIAYELYGETGHGKQWKQVAVRIGAIPKARGAFNLPGAPWLLVHVCSKTSEIEPITERFRRNRKIKNYFLTGRPDTQGELYFVAQVEFNQFKQGLLDKSRLVLVQ